MKKIGRNDKCSCGSKKKFKICCLPKEYELKLKEEEKYSKGQEISSDIVKICLEYFKKEFKDHDVINISDDLNEDSYRLFQTKNYKSKIIMIAEKNINNKEVFKIRSQNNEDIIVLYRGSYRVFNHKNLINVKESISKMIETRLAGKDET